MTTLKDALAEFELANRADGYSARTTDWYRALLSDGPHAIRRWLNAEHVWTVGDVTPRHLREYVVWLRGRSHVVTGKPLTEETVGDYRRAMHRFFKWASVEYDIPNPAAKLKYPKPQPAQIPRSISVEDFWLLFKSCLDTVQGIRNRAMLAFLLDTGCRAAGLCGLTIEDVHLKERYAVVIEKGNIPRMVLFSEKTRELLEAWYRVREAVSPLFYNVNTRAALTVNGLRQTINRMGRAAGCTGRINPHSFRHGFAVLAHHAGMDLRMLQLLLGHKRFSTTAEMYLLFAQKEVFEKYDLYSPISHLFAA